MMKEYIGYKFKPSDEELVDTYLYAIVTGQQTTPIIQEVNVYGNEEPWKIFQSHGLSKYGDHFYFFSKIKNKFSNGNTDIKERKAGQGSWLQQRSKGFHTTTLTASRTTLNFYHNHKQTGCIDRVNGRTKWIMHEFTLKGNYEWAVSRIYWNGKESDNDVDDAMSPAPAPALPTKKVNNGDLLAIPPSKRSKTTPSIDYCSYGDISASTSHNMAIMDHPIPTMTCSSEFTRERETQQSIGPLTPSVNCCSYADVSASTSRIDHLNMTCSSEFIIERDPQQATAGIQRDEFQTMLENLLVEDASEPDHMLESYTSGLPEEADDDTAAVFRSFSHQREPDMLDFSDVPCNYDLLRELATDMGM